MMMVVNKQVARYIIARIARKHGWTKTRAVTYAAERIGVKPRTIWRWLNGTHCPSDQNQYALSYAQQDPETEIEIVRHYGQPWRIQAQAALQAGLMPKIVKWEDALNGFKNLIK